MSDFLNHTAPRGDLASFTPWRQAFLDDCAKDKAGLRVWCFIEKQQGLNVHTVLLLLWRYSSAEETPEIAIVKKGQQEIARRLDAAIRARDKAEERRNDPRSEMFADREAEAMENLRRTPYPFRRDDIPIYGTAVLAHPELGGNSLENLYNGTRRKEPLDPRIWLLFLREYFRDQGVRIGTKRIVILAKMANPSRPCDLKRLKEFFKAPASKYAVYLCRLALQQGTQSVREL